MYSGGRSACCSVSCRTCQGSLYKGPLDCLTKIYKAEGIKGCYRGLIPQGFRDIKASGLYFLIYYWTLDTIGDFRNKQSLQYITIQQEKNTKKFEHGPLEMFCAGGLAGLVSWQAIIYLDIIMLRTCILSNNHILG
ncbi:mitochondrial carnitine/acylcarnitine carrier protein isoform X2 [Eurytemora carolleeae]|uniref:mitochondrial carnitine/acylcarnitine carrier protein isoform X2 n=1 Tax=Eurytemora carolleeae TaxID=1294199 RepID=UPI000C764216|nr:mitochondrial carnitine/acylcarnitine carrier protein isoform X2 [Eurytemora carolleeae]|eukprot:XP_023348556.1 mitochondrial carnitine/acylcarnitine carrier protein-like isoform X2 [Eurytemora affinis]